MALKDVKVLIFALMTFAQLLGLSFANFFPSCASPLAKSTYFILTFVVKIDGDTWLRHHNQSPISSVRLHLPYMLLLAQIRSQSSVDSIMRSLLDQRTSRR